MAFSLSDVSSLIQGLTPSASDIVQNLALGAATSVVVSGIKAQMSVLGPASDHAEPAYRKRRAYRRGISGACGARHE